MERRVFVEDGQSEVLGDGALRSGSDLDLVPPWGDSRWGRRSWFGCALGLRQVANRWTLSSLLGRAMRV